MEPNLNSLQQLLQKLPGIGPRQARRFAYFLLSVDKNYVGSLMRTVEELRQARAVCTFCHRIHFASQKSSLCPTCNNKNTVTTKVLVVEKNSDFENFDKNLVWDGRYFLVGRNLKITDMTLESVNSLAPLIQDIERGNITELIFALSANLEGEYTTTMLQKELADLCKDHQVKISKLARGLSTGSEIEYADAETLKQAIKRRD